MYLFDDPDMANLPILNCWLELDLKANTSAKRKLLDIGQAHIVLYIRMEYICRALPTNETI